MTDLLEGRANTLREQKATPREQNQDPIKGVFPIPRASTPHNFCPAKLQNLHG